jgi:hypothetical protein
MIMPNMVKVVKQDPKNKIYLICLRTANGDYWSIEEGRRAAWDYIKDHVIQDDADVLESFVLVDSVELRKRVTVYDFIKYSESMVNDPEFDIEDYVNGDVIDTTEPEVESPIKEEDMINMNQILMQGFMDGDALTKDLK